MSRWALILAIVSAAAPAPAEEDAPPELELHPRALFGQHLYEGPFQDPMGLAIDDVHKEIVVADTRGDRIGIFTLQGGPLFSFGGTDVLREPRKVAVDRKGRILVLDRDRSQIKVFNYRGDYLGPLALQGMRPSPRFEAIAVDRDGNVYVGEAESQQVWVFTPELKLKMRLGGHGAAQGIFSSMAGIAVDAENIVVSDHSSVPVQVFERGGKFVCGFGRHDMGRENFSLPEGIALDGKGRIVVVDSLRHEIKFFDKSGKFIARFGGLGFKPGQVAFPSDVAVDAAGLVYVLEKVGARVTIFDEIVPTANP